MKNCFRCAIGFLFLVLVSQLAANGNIILKKDYLEYAKTAAEDYWQNYDADIKSWADRIDLKYVFGYNPPGNPLSYAYVAAHLYNITGDEKYTSRVRSVLVDYGKFKNYYPKDFWKNRPSYEKGVPALANFFTIAYYIKAYSLLKDVGILSKSDIKIIEQNIAESCNHQLRMQEWGAMNRGVLRADTFYPAALTMPEHPDAAKWKMIAKSILDDCYANWEIEDASLYNAVYEYALTSLIDFLNDQRYWNAAVTRYKMQFYSRLLAPHGMIPDYGDAHLYSNWNRFLPVFEKAAAEYNDPEIKYTATRIAQTFWDFAAEQKSIWLATVAIDCYRWADDNIVPKEPPQKSELVLDDVVGKKVVFRTGYKPTDSYLLLNFKDEGNSGFLSREYLRQSIPVEEEKMTHGHADENSIPLLMVDGSLLLHDGGYRDYMPSGEFGAYRADYFHNRVVVRKNKFFKGQQQGMARYSTKDSVAVTGQNILDFVRNSGAYRPVRTELIDFLTTEDFDYCRTRLTDDKLNYQYDRIISWVKPLNIFVVFDVVKFLEDDYYTAVNFWHTRKILSQGKNYFDTQYDSLQSYAFPTNLSLLIFFPDGNKNGRTIGTEHEQRYFQQERAIHQSLSQYFFSEDLAAFTTVLIPHKKDSDLMQLLNNISMVEVDRSPHAVGVKIKSADKTYFVCSKLDRQIDLHHKDERPRYDYEHGKVKYENFETDGHQLFAVMEGKQLKYISVYCVKMVYKNKTLFEQLPVLFGLQYTDGIDRAAVGKLRYWQDEVKVE